MSASLSPRHEAAILPSLPPSPSFLEEVFSHPHPWNVRFEEFDLHSSRLSSPGPAGSHAKGKGKQTLDDENEEDDENTQHHVGTHEAYPPMTDEAAETRRVEETLRRWELAERQRRKSLRESVHHTYSPSLISSVTRTAGLVLSGRNASISTTVGPGSTRAFKSHEAVDVAREGYAVPLDDIDPSGNVAVHSPSPSIFERSTSLDAGTGSTSGTSENPFVHPSEHAPTRLLTPVTSTPMLRPSTPPSSSPFADSRGQQIDLPMHARKRSSGSREPFVQSPPPPPPKDRPRVTPLQPTSQPALRPRRREDPEERQEVRWWHDWLCGCNEGPDRGGDNQAGRTNPFE